MTSAIVVNARFRVHPLTGVERYSMEVTRRLGDRVRLLNPMRNGSGLLGHLWEQFALPGRLGEHDLLWSPANTGPLRVRNQVVTIHDISPIDHPNWFESKFAAWYGYLLPRLASWARQVITDSDFSRQRIIEAFRLPASKVVRIPCGVDMNSFRPAPEAEMAYVRRRYNLPETYVLAVGTLEPRKNLDMILQAWERVSQEHRHIDLVVVGGTSRSFPPLRLRSLPHRVHMKGRVESADMPALYSGALALIMPSLYEGFGLPVLEAMACGTPVIASNVTALPEVVGNAGLLVDPYDVEAIAGTIAKVIGDTGLRADLVRRGFERAGLYSWDRTGEMVWQVLQEAAQ